MKPQFPQLEMNNKKKSTKETVPKNHESPRKSTVTTPSFTVRRSTGVQMPVMDSLSAQQGIWIIFNILFDNVDRFK